MARPFRIFIPFTLLSLGAAAQPPASNWENVKMLAPQTRLLIASSASRKPFQGTLESVTDSDLVIRRDGSPQSIPRSQILAVSIRQHHRLRNALIGLGVGTAAGFLIGYAEGHREESSCKKSGGWFCGLEPLPPVIIGTSAGVIGGPLAGAFWPGGWRKIYVP